MRSPQRHHTSLLCGIIVGASLLAHIAPEMRLAAEDTNDHPGVFAGQVVLEGEIPKLEAATTLKDPQSADLKVCGITQVPGEKLVVDPQTMGIANVFVYLKQAPAGMPVALKQANVPTVNFGQKDCRFTPHALLVRTDQTLQIRSHDPVELGHNAHFYPTRNTSYGSAIRADRNAIETRTFKQAERSPIQVKCDIHPWMTAWCLVLDHPYAAVTDAQGRFKISDLPPGKHEFIVWHESAGYLERAFLVQLESQQNLAPVTIKTAVAKFKL